MEYVAPESFPAEEMPPPEDWPSEHLYPTCSLAEFALVEVNAPWPRDGAAGIYAWRALKAAQEDRCQPIDAPLHFPVQGWPDVIEEPRALRPTIYGGGPLLPREQVSTPLWPGRVVYLPGGDE